MNDDLTKADENPTDNLETIDPDAGDSPRRRVPYVVVLAGESVGRVVRLEPNSSVVAGRARSCEVYFDCENISREHARFTISEAGATTLHDLNSTNGTLVNGKKVEARILEDGDRICMGNVILRFSLKDDLEFGFHQDLYDKATKDPMTGAFNKRFLMETLDKEFSYHLRHDKPLSLMIFDIDDFKRLNDTYGHMNGDIVLKSVSREITACLRFEDLFARFGGEEFVALFRFTTRENALRIAEKLLELIRGLEFATSTTKFSITATCGVATLEGGNFDKPEALLMKADQNLYIGKSRGKDQVVG